MTLKLIPKKWETHRLIIRDSTLDEVEDLQAIDDIVPQTRGWTHNPGRELPKEPILSALMDGVLPPGGKKEQFRLQSIRTGESERLVGFLGVYHGFPDADVFWINTLTLHPDEQGKGFGVALINGLVDVVRNLGTYTKLQTYVPLLNWPSLRLCTKVGFNTMVRIEGDKVFTEGGEAHVLVEKELKEL